MVNSEFNPIIHFYSNSPFQTRKIGEILGKELLKLKKRKGAFILGLKGELGSGKTTFLQGFAKGLGQRGKIISPTFVIVKKFKVYSLRFKVFYHIDCYRLKNPKEIFSLGFKEISLNPKNIIAIEWVDRIKRFLPKKTLILEFETTGNNKRKIRLCYNSKK